MEYVYRPYMASPPFQDLDEKRITPDEYARRTRREVVELIRDTPTPRRREVRNDDDDRKS
jgi:hypothetical protein